MKDFDEEAKTKIDKLISKRDEANLDLKKNKSELTKNGVTGFGYLGIFALSLSFALLLPEMGNIPFPAGLFSSLILGVISLTTWTLGVYACTKLVKLIKDRKALKKAVKDYSTEIEQTKLESELQLSQQSNQNKITKDTYKNTDNEVENSTNNTL